MGFITTASDGGRTAYIGSYTPPTVDLLREMDRRPVIANRKLVQPEQSFEFYVYREIEFQTQQISWHRKEAVDVTFVKSFSMDSFAYFFFYEVIILSLVIW